MKTLAERIAADGITISVEEGAPESPEFAGSVGYTVTLRLEDRTMTLPYYMGPALVRTPTVEDVLDSLLSDADSVSNSDGSLETWADHYGFELDDEIDRPRTEQVYQVCRSQTEQLRLLLGDDRLKEYLYETETD